MMRSTEDLLAALRPRGERWSEERSAQRYREVVAEPGGPVSPVRRARRARPVWVAAAAALVVAVLAGAAWQLRLFGWGESPTVMVDCQQAVRWQGTVYEQRTYLDLRAGAARRLGTADRSSCDDRGPTSRGVYFPDSPETTPVVEVPGFASAITIGVDDGSGSLSVFVSERASKAQADQVELRVQQLNAGAS